MTGTALRHERSARSADPNLHVSQAVPRQRRDALTGAISNDNRIWIGRDKITIVNRYSHRRQGVCRSKRQASGYILKIKLLPVPHPFSGVSRTLTGPGLCEQLP